MSLLDFLFGGRITAIETRLSILENKEKTDMSTSNDAFAKLSADVTAETTAVSGLSTQLTTATTNINNALNDLKAQINSQPGMPDISAQLAAIEQNTATITAAADSLTSLSATAQSDDPGAPASTPVNS